MTVRPAAVPSLAYAAGIAERLAASHRNGGTLLLVSDFDGTLTPIVRDPAEAWLSPAVREDLRALSTSARVVVGIASGRDLEDLRARIGLPSVIYAACHGLVVAGPGLAFEHDGARAQRALLAALAEELGRRAAPLLGVRVEPKSLSVAVHYRNASPIVLPALLALVRDVMRVRPGYAILRGRKVLEVMPTRDWDKGRCVQWIERRLEERIGHRVTTLYLGDDLADERVFAALHGRGITVRIGEPTPTRAAYRLPRVEDVHRLLSTLADHVREAVTR